MLRQMLSLSRWTGGKSQAEIRAEYYRQRMWDAVRRLEHSADVLGEVLVEILAELSVATPECP